MNIKSMAAILARKIKEHVARELGAVTSRFADLEAKFGEIKAIKAEKGDPGAPGKDADPEFIRSEVARAIEAMPKAKDGEPGKPGRDGESVHPDTVTLMIRDAAEKVAANLPKPKDGRDGFGLEDFDMQLGADGRTLSLKFTRGELVVERQVRLATMIYRGVWREGENEPGDVCTWGGSAWHCQDKTTDKPGTSSAWKMMVKEGQRGKDGNPPAAAAVHQPVKFK